MSSSKTVESPRRIAAFLIPKGGVNSKSGFGGASFFAQPPTGNADDILKQRMQALAKDPAWRKQVERALGTIDWAEFEKKLADADFKQFRSWWEARSLGFADAGLDGKWLVGVPEGHWMYRSAIGHELFHLVDDFATGLFGKQRTLTVWARAEFLAHWYGGPMLGRPFIIIVGGGGTYGLIRLGVETWGLIFED